MSTIQAEQTLDKLFDGVMLQIINCGLDILVEKKIYEEHPEFHAIQLASLCDMMVVGVKSVQEGEKQSDYFPASVISISRTLNYCSAFMLKRFYNIDMTGLFKLTSKEKMIANSIMTMADFYLTEGYQPGDEYKLVEHTAKEVGFEKFISMMNEDEFEKRGTESSPADEERERMQSNIDFAVEHGNANPTETTMMAMYMLGALQEFEKMSSSDINRIALEIAVVGLNGISPNKKGYKISSFEGREFSGYQFLAYYYVSWAKAHPERLKDLGLPFDEAYEMAFELYKKTSK